MATIPIADVITTERLPIDAQDVITKVRLVIAGSLAGREPETRITRQFDDSGDTSGTVMDHYHSPVTFEYEHAQHAALRCERAFGLPEGFNPFLTAERIPSDPDVTGVMSNPGDPSAVRDGDLSTYGGIENLAAGSGVMTYSGDGAGAFYGFRLVYSLHVPGTASLFYTRTSALVSLILSSRDPTFGAIGGGGDAGVTYPASEARFVWPVGATNGVDDVNDFYAVAGFDARIDAANAGGEPLMFSHVSLQCLQAAGGGELRVFEFYPLYLDTGLLEDVARANVRLPAQNPTRVTVTGVVPPDREHTITGWPGGDFTASVAQQQYELGRTIIDFEQAGAPTGLPAEAVEAARERATAVRAEVARASYALRMGERQ